MWRSIAARSSLSRNLRRKLISLLNPPPSSSQVFNQKCFFNSLSQSNSSYLLNRSKPRNFDNRNLRFLSHSSSSISDFESENVNDASSSSEELEGENETHVVDSSNENLNISQDFDGNDENNGAQISGFGLNDQLGNDFDGNGENDGAQMSGFGLNDQLGNGFDGNGENDDAQISGVTSFDQDSVEGVCEEGVDVEKLENVLSLLQSTLDGSFESSLESLELRLNEEFMVRVMETPLVPGENLIRFFNWALSKKEFTVTTSVVFESLARAICNEPKRKNAYALWDLVQGIGKENGVIKVDLLNQLISAFSKMGKGKAAFEVFGKVEEFGCVPSSDTYYLTLEALCKRSFYDWAGSVCQKMLDARVLPDSNKVGDIISFFCKGLRSKEAHSVYLSAKQDKKYPPQKAVNFLISCLSKVDESVPLAQQMLGDFSDGARKHAINPFSWVIRGLCIKNDVKAAKQLLLEMIEKGPPPGNSAFNTVINTLSKSGEMEEAKAMVKLMESRGLKPDVFSYTVIISGYAKAGLMDEACKVLADARKKHPKLCPPTFHTLIRGYCKLEQFDKAVKLLSDMSKHGVEPNVDEYNKLIQSLCLKALDWKTAEKLLDEMKSKGLHLPGISRGLIAAVKELEEESSLASEEAVAVA